MYIVIAGHKVHTFTPMLYLMVQVFMVPCQNMSSAETAKVCRILSPEYADHIKLHPTLQHITAYSQTIDKPDEDQVAPYTLSDFVVGSAALEQAVLHLYHQLMSAEAVYNSLFHISAATEAIMKSVPADLLVRYEDNMDPVVGSHAPHGPFYMEDVQPTAFPRPGYPLPPVQVVPDTATGADSTYFANTPGVINGSCRSVNALAWSDDLISSQRGKEGNNVPVVNGVTTSTMIASDPGARTTDHIEQKGLGALNLLVVGPLGKIWYIFPKYFRAKLAKRCPEADALIFSKTLWQDLLEEPEFLLELNVRRIHQPEGYMMVSMPVGCHSLCIKWYNCARVS